MHIYFHILHTAAYCFRSCAALHWPTFVRLVSGVSRSFNVFSQYTGGCKQGPPPPRQWSMCTGGRAQHRRTLTAVTAPADAHGNGRCARHRRTRSAPTDAPSVNLPLSMCLYVNSKSLYVCIMPLYTYTYRFSVFGMYMCVLYGMCMYTYVCVCIMKF